MYAGVGAEIQFSSVDEESGDRRLTGLSQFLRVGFPVLLAIT